MQKSKAAEQEGLDEIGSLTPVPGETDQELSQAILDALPAIMKLLNQK